MFIRNGSIIRLGSKLFSLKPATHGIKKPAAYPMHFLSRNAHSEGFVTFASVKAVKHIFVLKGGELSLWKHNPMLNEYLKLSENMIVTREYNILKEISHIPFLIQTLLFSANLKDVDLSIQKKAELKKIHDEVLIISQKIHLNSSDSENQQSILKKTLAFLTGLINHPESEQINLQDKVAVYLKSISSELERNKALATQVQLATLNETVEHLRSEYSVLFNDAQTIIVGPQGPRRGLIEKQYFDFLYQQETGLTNNIHYVEYLPKDIPSIDIEKDLIGDYLAHHLNKFAQGEEKFVNNRNDQTERMCPEKKVTLNSLGVDFATETSLEKLNEQFLTVHHQAATHMLDSVKTIVIYYDGVLSYWQQDGTTKKYSCLQQKSCTNPRELSDMMKVMQLDLTTSRFVVCGSNSSGELQSFIDYFIDLYDGNSTPNNRYVYHIESNPKNKDILEHVIESFLPVAELNKKYGEALKGNSDLMFTDVLANYASPYLSVMYKSEETEVLDRRANKP